MTVLLRSEMILAAADPPARRPSLDPVGMLVYQCAERSMTVGETVAASDHTQEIIEQTVCELVSMKLIVVLPPVEKPAASNSGLPDELETFYKTAHQADYYELLGVDPDTPRTEIRNRYFELSKRFHPDKAFGHVAKERKDKMTFVFQRLTLAYDVLSNAKKKAEYDASISDQLELRAIEKKLKAAMEQKRSFSAPPSKSESIRLSSPSLPDESIRLSSPSLPDESTRLSSPSLPDESTRLSSPSLPDESTRLSSPSLPSGSTPPETSTGMSTGRFVPSGPSNSIDESRREEIKRRRAGQAVADLLRRRSDSPATPLPVDSVDSLLDEAALALEQLRFAEAAGLCKKILELFPENTKAKDILKQVSEAQAKVQAQMHLRRGRYAVREGQIKEAKWHLEQAAAMDKGNIEARHLLAEILLLHERDFFSALALMKEVIVLGGQRSRYFVTLGDIFLEMKDSERAADAYNKALRMEPENKELKKKLRLCKR